MGRTIDIIYVIPTIESMSYYKLSFGDSTFLPKANQDITPYVIATLDGSKDIAYSYGIYMGMSAS